MPGVSAAAGWIFAGSICRLPFDGGRGLRRPRYAGMNRVYYGKADMASSKGSRGSLAVPKGACGLASELGNGHPNGFGKMREPKSAAHPVGQAAALQALTYYFICT